MFHSPRRGAALMALLAVSLGHQARADESNAVEVHVHHLRRKLGAALIKTVRGVGYMLLPERQPSC